MNEAATARHSIADLPRGLPMGCGPTGVGGWLLALCVMLTIVGPAISVWLMVHAYTEAAPLAARHLSEQASLLASLLLSTCAVAFGAYAGTRLWRIRPNAVATAKRALLFGLAVDLVTTAIETATAGVASAHWLFQLDAGLIPGLVFFTLCFAYLNRSRRVLATYGP